MLANKMVCPGLGHACPRGPLLLTPSLACHTELTKVFARPPTARGRIKPPLAPPLAKDVRSVAVPALPDEQGPPRRRISGQLIRGMSGFMVSLVFHAAVLLALALFGLWDEPVPTIVVMATYGAQTEPPTLLEPLENKLNLDQDPAQAPQTDRPQDARLPEAPNIASPLPSPVAATRPSQPAAQAMDIPREALWLRSLLATGGGLEGRTQQMRAELAGRFGGTPESESAVERGLAWLAAHQREDGGWRLNHQEGPCAGRCGDPGMLETSTGATGLALLPFLGAGYTHRDGPYRDVVDRGIYYLTSRMKETSHGGDLQEGTMYAQGIATLALCEAYAMTGDQTLEPYAQKAVNFICAAQHPRGGWRYYPGQPGDTTVTGWQMMALKSAKLARLYVPSPVTELVKEYLNHVQDGGGAFYGYQTSDKAPGPTAVGLLLRMYLEWPRDDERLARGVHYLANRGPSTNDVYFDYYATQVLHHYGGPLWEGWNARMRDYLVTTQSTSGHEAGSWFFPDQHGSVGGRLYTTAMCIMILEVYYRYMPLYGNRAVEEGF